MPTPALKKRVVMENRITQLGIIKRMEKWIGLLDCNNFFVSCERLFRPDLAGKPVAVLSSNDGCIVARSQEVKDIGIPMGVPYFKVKDILKTEGVTLFSGNPTLYRDVSTRVFKAMRTVLEDIDKYSIDEAFFVLEGTPQEVERKALVIKDRVEQLAGIPVSVGVAKSKTLAKLANDEAKRTTGVFVMDENDWKERCPKTDLSKVWGIGSQLSKRFRAVGLITVEDLLNSDDSQLKSIFGIVGLRLKTELNGANFVASERSNGLQKSLMSSRTFKETTEDISVLQKSLAYHINKVGEELRILNLETKCLRVNISPSRYGDFALQNASAEGLFAKPTNITSELLKEGNVLLEQLFKEAVPYKKLGVLAANLTSAEVTQLGMFDDEDRTKAKELQSAIDAINRKAGVGKIHLGTTISADTWKPRSDLRSPAYTTKWKDIPTVKA